MCQSQNAVLFHAAILVTTAAANKANQIFFFKKPSPALCPFRRFYSGGTDCNIPYLYYTRRLLPKQ